MAGIGEASRRSGVGIEAIRYYERKGVVASPARTEGGRRDYDDQGIARLRMIRRCRDLGFTLPQSQSLLELAEDAQTECSDVKLIGEKHIAHVDRKIEELQRLKTALGDLLNHCRRAGQNCPALMHLFGEQTR
jgi:MerR family mercuric resistance operon transcriptional regulator